MFLEIFESLINQTFFETTVTISMVALSMYDQFWKRTEKIQRWIHLILKQHDDSKNTPDKDFYPRFSQFPFNSFPVFLESEYLSCIEW